MQIVKPGTDSGSKRSAETTEHMDWSALATGDAHLHMNRTADESGFSRAKFEKTWSFITVFV